MCGGYRAGHGETYMIPFILCAQCNDRENTESLLQHCHHIWIGHMLQGVWRKFVIPQTTERKLSSMHRVGNMAESVLSPHIYIVRG